MTEHNPTTLATAPGDPIESGEESAPESASNPPHLDPASTAPADPIATGEDSAPESSSNPPHPDPATTAPGDPIEPGEDSAPESASNPPHFDPATTAATVAEEATAGVTTPEASSPDHAEASAEDAEPDTTSTDEVDLADPESGESAEVDVPADEDHLPPGQTEVPVGEEVVIDDATMRRAIEAILMVTDEPLPVLTLARAVGRPTGDVADALTGLAEEYTEQGRGFDLREVGGGWRYYTRVEAAPYVERFVLDGQQARLTQAALETLSVVAYKQPVSRARVSAIRGVNVDGVMRTLVARGLVEEAGADTESQATLYRTTSYFLERMGMQSLDDLPELAPYLPDMDDIEDELAAQTLPPTPTEEAATPNPDDPAPDNTDEDTAGTAYADEPASDATDEHAAGTAYADEAAPDDRDEDSADDTDQADDADVGIDGDLTADDSVGLDVEDEPSDLEPTDEAESTGELTDEAGSVEPAAGEVESADVAVDEAELGDAGTGIDGDLTIDDWVDLDVEHDLSDLEPTDEAEPAGEVEPVDVVVGEVESADEVADEAESVRDGADDWESAYGPADEVANAADGTDQGESGDEAARAVEHTDEDETDDVDGELSPREGERDGDEAGVRLQKVLAQAGVASRRSAELLIEQGRVEVDGSVVTEFGVRVDPEVSVIRVDGERIPPVSAHAYLVLNKPRGVVTTMADPQGRPCIADYVQDRPERLFHIGRLDTDTEGLLLLTNHGEFAHRLAHPSYEVSKTYVAEVEGNVKPGVLRRLLDGVNLEDGPAQADTVKVISSIRGRTLIQITLHEGRNRIVRRMFDAIGHPVKRLTRTAIGPVRRGNLHTGELRPLDPKELGQLLDLVDL